MRFKITMVNGPTTSTCKVAFFVELVNHKPPSGVMWLALGCFNQIYYMRDKNKRTSIEVTPVDSETRSTLVNDKRFISRIGALL